LSLSEEGLAEYFKLNFSLINNKHFTLAELEDMLPWERSIYVGLLKQKQEKED